VEQTLFGSCGKLDRYRKWCVDFYTQRQYPKFDGWNAVSQRLLSDNDSTNDLSPAAAQRVWNGNTEEGQRQINLTIISMQVLEVRYVYQFSAGKFKVLFKLCVE